MGSASPPPERLGPYRLIELLATGGMSQVYLARRDGDTRYCVVKILRPSTDGAGTATIRIRREAHVASFLSHPNVASVLGAAEEGARFYIAYEFISGRTVADLLRVCVERKISFPAPVALAIAVKTLRGLSHAHELQDGEGNQLRVVHRDITPQNLMVSYGGDVKIIDFGVVRAMIDGKTSRPGYLVGTPQYMSPEQVCGTEVDARSDIYSLGCVLYEMLTLRTAIPEKSNFRLLFGAIILEHPEPPSKYVPELPPALDDVILRALAKKPHERHQTARELRQALEATPTLVASATELATFVNDLIPMERRHVLALQADSSDQSAAQTVDDTLEDPTLPPSLAANLRPPPRQP